MKCCAIFLLQLLLGVAFVSASHRITGRVLSDGEAEPFATLRIFALADSASPLYLGTADDNGVFSFGLESAGEYRLVVQASGRAELEQSFVLPEDKAEFDLGDINLDVSNVQLDEVSVTAQRPLVSRDIDRLGYDVQADIEAATSPLSEVLKKVPLVSVESDGTIKVKGSTNFKIYKNGRPNRSFSNNAKDVFAAIPASSIKKIEVITDPGAREDAEGVSTILNIVTMKDTEVNGITGSASMYYSTTGDLPNPNLWLMGQVGKFTVSGYGGASFVYGKRSDRSRTRFDRVYDQTGNRLLSESDSKRKGTLGYWGIEASWEPDELNLVTFDFSGYASVFKSNSETHTNMLAPDGDRVYGYTRYDANPKINYLDFNFGVNYQRSTRLKGEAVTLSYLLSTTGQHNISTERYDDMINPPVPYTAVSSDFDLRFFEHTLQLDWTRPLAEGHMLDVGAKYIRRDNHSTTMSEYVGWQYLEDRFTHLTDIAAIYADYRLRLGRWGARAGVRYEYSKLRAKFDDDSREDFGSSLNDIVPNAAVSYNVSDASSLKLSYSSNINRPGISYLNPAVSYSPTMTSAGNPDLGSAHYNNLTLNYNLITPKVSLNIDAGYGFSNSVISPMRYVEGEHVYQTYGNVDNLRRFILTGWMQWSITPKTRWMINGSVFHTSIHNSEADITERGVNFSLYTQVTQKLPWNLEASASLWWGNGALNSIYSRIDYHTYGRDYTINLQRSFLADGRLTVAIAASNIFGPSTQKYYSYDMNTGYEGRTTTYSLNAQSVILRVSYRFGKLNAQVKKTSATISNDDLVGRKN